MLEKYLQRIRANDPTLTQIDFRDNRIGDQGARALAEALKQNQTVTQIDLEGNKIGAQGAQALADALKINTSVTTIDLQWNDIGDAGAQALGDALKLNTTVTTIDLEGNNIGDAGAQALGDALKLNKSVTEIYLSSNNIGAAGAQALADALKVNKSVTQINLRENQIGTEGAQALDAIGTAVYLRNSNLLDRVRANDPTLTQINLRQNHIGATGAQALAEALKQNRIVKTIYLNDNNIGATGAQALAEALKQNRIVKTIYLNDNNIGATGAQALAEALKQNRIVKTIYLNDNNIGATGAQALAEALKQNRTVKTIYLDDNNIGATGAQALGDALKLNTTVTTINLEGNNIGAAGAQALAYALKVNKSVTQINLRENQIGTEGAQALDAIGTAVYLRNRNLLDRVRANDPTLTQINLRQNNIGATGAQALADALKINTSVTTIDLQWNDIGDAGAQALAEALKQNRTMKTIYLNDNNIGAQGAQALAEALKQNQTVTQIDLVGNIWSSNKIGAEGAQALDAIHTAVYLKNSNLLNRVRANDPTLTQINLRQNHIGATGAQALADALKLNTTVTTIDLEGNNIGAEGAQALADALKQNQTVTQISLRSNKIGAQGAQALDAIGTAVYLRNSRLLERVSANDSTLTKIYLSSNEIGATGAQALADALKINTCVTTIKLQWNHFGDAGAQALADALKVNKSVTQINLVDNQIGDQGAQALADALKVNKSVTQINLVGNKIGDQGAQALADALKVNKSMTKIKLIFNNIRDAGAQALAEALKQNKTVTLINLSENNIGDACALALADALKVNTSVTEINLSENNIGDAGACALAHALKNNTSVTTVHLNSNDIGNAGAYALADALKINTSITDINLWTNNIGDAGALALAEALKLNKTVTTICFDIYHISATGAQAFANALKVNTSVTNINFSDLMAGEVEGEENEPDEDTWEALEEAKTSAARNKKKAEKLITSVNQGDINTVKSLLTKGVSLNHQDEEGNTALHYAIQRENLEIVCLLLINSPQLVKSKIASSLVTEFKNENGNTLLHQAVLLAEQDAALAYKLIESLLSFGAKRYVTNQAGKYPFQLCRAATEHEREELRKIRNLLKPKPAEQLFIDHIVTNHPLKPLVEKLSNTLLAMDDLTVSLRSNKSKQDYKLPGKLGIRLLFKELKTFLAHLMKQDAFDCEEKSAWKQFLTTCWSNYKKMTKTESVHTTVSQPKLNPPAVETNSLIIETNNLATQAFLGDGSDQNPSHLHFRTWYHPDVCHYLLQLVPNQARCIRVIFSDAGYGNNTQTFKDQLQQLVMLSNALQRPAIFISKEPGADNHYICGLIKGSNLLLINPLGITNKSDCYQTIFELKKEGAIGEVWFSSNSLQKHKYEEEGLVSCGAVSLELATHVLSQITADKLEEFWNQLKTNEPTIHEQSGLTYHGINIKDLLPETLQTLECAGDENTYKAQALSIRSSHLQQLKVLPAQSAKAEKMATDDYLKKCKERALSQVLFNRLVTRENNIANIIELVEYKQFQEELDKPVIAVSALPFSNPMLIQSSLREPLVTHLSKHSPKTLSQSKIDLEQEPATLSEKESAMVKELILNLQQIDQLIFQDRQASLHRDEVIQDICIPNEWVKKYGLQQADVQASKKRKRKTDESPAEEIVIVDDTELPSDKRQKTDDSSTEESQTKVHELEQRLALSLAKIKELEQRLAKAGIAKESESASSNSMTFFPTLQK